jgi:hypothetical protein
VIICYTIAIALLLMSIIMYIEYIEKFLNGVKKAYAKLFKKSLTQEKPIRKKSAPQKRKPNKKNNKR